MSGEETLTYSGQGEMTVKEVKVKIGSLLSQGKVSGHRNYFSELQIFLSQCARWRYSTPCPTRTPS